MSYIHDLHCYFQLVSQLIFLYILIFCLYICMLSISNNINFYWYSLSHTYIWFSCAYFTIGLHIESTKLVYVKLNLKLYFQLVSQLTFLISLCMVFQLISICFHFKFAINLQLISICITYLKNSNFVMFIYNWYQHGFFYNWYLKNFVYKISQNLFYWEKFKILFE